MRQILAGDFHYGGQAVIEGVMIRGKTAVSTAVRRPDGDIIIHTEPPLSLVQKYRWLNVPILRGAPALFDALRIGYRSLIYSANMTMEAEGVEPPSTLQYAGSLIFAFAFAIGFFVVLPNLGLHAPQVRDLHFVTKNILEGLLKIALFILYVLCISRLEHVKRLFQYHGAEHMVINAYEHGRAITPEDAKDFSTIHVRCGSSFIMLVLFVAIIVHMLAKWPVWYWAIPLRIVMLFPIAGISYEVMKLSASPKVSWLTRIVTRPGLWLQRLTTKQPTPDQIEVAVAALKGVLEAEQEQQRLAAGGQGPEKPLVP